MRLAVIILVCFIFNRGTACISNKRFPDGFRFGVATSAYQIEGAWNQSGKGQSIWDYTVHNNPSYIHDGSTGDIACNSYNQYKRDIELLKELNVDTYRFSISWPRLLPSGLVNNVNQDAVKYYGNFIKELKLAGIEPMVTLYHWDLPLALKSIGGWTNSVIVEYFGDYARLAFKLFGDDVKIWTTFNEPIMTCANHFGLIVNDSNLLGIGEYLCAHNLLKSHAKAYHIYSDEFKPKQKGKISIVLNNEWFMPLTNGSADTEATKRGREFVFGWYAHPIFLGDYPQRMKDAVSSRSLKEGFPKSRLPEFTDEEIDYINGTHDYLGINEYTSSKVQNFNIPIGTSSFLKDIGILTSKDPSWPASASDWLKVEPLGIRNTLTWVWNTYHPVEIIITENGYADNGELIDRKRINYHQQYLSNVLDAIFNDNVNVTGYMAWSLMDNFEWQDGYRAKFGFYSVDFNDPKRRRTPKLSAKFYKSLCQRGCLTLKCV